MHRFRVWAPDAEQVDVVLDDGRVPMERDGEWWTATVTEAGPGTRYYFALDEGPPRPDPRSAFQPEGIDGPSMVLDHASFEWTDRRWRGLPWRGAIVYEIHIGTFTSEGTFASAIQRLPHLAALGVDAIEIMPVAEFSGERGWGYDGVDLFAPHHVYGGPAGLKELVDACHRAGIGVVLDVVYNHLGPAGNYLPEFGPYFSTRHHTTWGAALNVDGRGSDEVRRYVIDNALMWLRDYHIDGLRLDAVHAIVDESPQHILEELVVEVDALAAAVGRPLFIVAESDRNDPRLVRSRAAGGFGLDSAWADDWHHALHAALTGERAGYYEDFGSLAVLAKALRQAWVHDGTFSRHRGHRVGRSPAGLAGHQFVVCTQNHDQVGNRATGDRPSAHGSRGRLAIAGALLLTSPFTPLLFQGEEWGTCVPFQYFTDHRDPELGAAVRDGRREEFAAFGWEPDAVPDPQDPATYLRSKLVWDEPASSPYREMLAWYRTLITLRGSYAELVDPRLETIDVDVCEADATLVVHRGRLSVAVNLGSSAARFRVPAGGTVVASWDRDAALDGTQLRVPPDSVAILDGRAAHDCGGAQSTTKGSGST